MLAVRPVAPPYRGVLLVALAALVVVAAPGTVPAQTDTMYVLLPDLCVFPCDTLLIPVRLFMATHALAGYSLQYVLNRPGLVTFSPDSVYSKTGTLTQDWESTSGLSTGATSVNVVGVADYNGDGTPPPIGPSINPGALLDFLVHVPCSPDTISGNTVTLLPAKTDFSDPSGTLLTSVATRPGTITVLTSNLGDVDQSGGEDVRDVIMSINCAFRGDCLGCAAKLADLNCDHLVNIQDVILLINHVFRAGPPPACP